MLTQYLSDTRLLLNDTLSEFYSDGELTGYVNQARSYVCGVGECLRDDGTVTVSTRTAYIVFSLAIPATISSQSELLTVRSMWVFDGNPIEVRPYPWWNAYIRTGTIQPIDRIAAVAKQGAAGAGAGAIVIRNGDAVTLPYYLAFDGIWLSTPLVNDGSAEDIPRPWTDTICYYAAYLALIRAQRQSDANLMLSRFNNKLADARRSTTSSELPGTSNDIGGPGTKEAAQYATLTTPQE